MKTPTLARAAALLALAAVLLPASPVRAGGVPALLQGGRVFVRTGAGPLQLPCSAETTAFVSFKGALVALRRGGSVHVWLEREKQWAVVPGVSDAVQLAAAGRVLVALGRDGRLSAYRSDSKDGSLAGRPRASLQDGGMAAIDFEPVDGGRPVAFHESGVARAAYIAPLPGRGDVLVRLRDGRASLFSRLARGGTR
ncbi:MAG: hypothetical protein KGL53_14850 [Elusimicrobia bacterium]|nr:hypothetical protein [Elusimicrobiota bacterium]